MIEYGNVSLEKPIPRKRECFFNNLSKTIHDLQRRENRYSEKINIL
jgi:hypothetical protein